LLTNLQPVSSVNGVGELRDLPLFFAIVIFAFEGIAVILPIENQMDEPQHFISNNGVLNTACLIVLAAYATMGFYGYLAFGADVKDTVTLNLPNTVFYQLIKIMFVGCILGKLVYFIFYCHILVSYPLQFYVPIERIEKYISKKVPEERQNFLVYLTRYLLVIITCALAEVIPHLALFISLIGAFAGTGLALIFPPFIDLLVRYSKKTLTWKSWIVNIILFLFGFVGFVTGTYTSLRDIISVFGQPDDI
jgi:proton-coupled amino acid transporter